MIELWNGARTLGAERRKNVQMNPRVTDWAAAHIQAEALLARKYSVKESSPSIGMIAFENHTNKVNLKKRRCTCKASQDLNIPCRHVIAVMSARMIEPYSFGWIPLSYRYIHQGLSQWNLSGTP